MSEYPTFDAIDAAIRDESANNRDIRDGARVGDFIVMPDGELRRFTYHWGDRIQTTMSRGDGSFYLGRNGGVSHSGGLDRAIPLEQIADTGERRLGSFWFFHHGHSGAHRGVECKVLCRVYRMVPACVLVVARLALREGAPC